MASQRRTVAYGLIALLCLTCTVQAQRWEGDRYPVSITGPNEWVMMNQAMLAQANAGVNHITGSGFIAGFTLRDNDRLAFPYLLVQYKPYDTLPEALQPKGKLDERGKLELICALVPAFNHRGPLPETIDTPQFIDRFGNDHARLVRLEDDRFDFAGKIPHEADEDPIRYHTHGLMGKDGVALATVFSIESFSDLAPVIASEMRTLAFSQGHGFAALPDTPPALPATATAEAAATEPASGAETDAPNAADPPVEDRRPAESTTPASAPAQEGSTAAPAAHQGNSTALVLIISVLTGAFFIIALIVWWVTHLKEQARRERARARRQRLQAIQQRTTQVSHQPRMTKPANPSAPADAARQPKHAGQQGQQRQG